MVKYVEFTTRELNIRITITMSLLLCVRTCITYIISTRN